MYLNLFNAEIRTSAAWTIAYQPGLPGEVVNDYQKMFDFLGAIVIDTTTFNAMKMRQMACIQVINAFAAPTNNLLRDFGFIVDNNVVLSFSDKVHSRATGTIQSGQNVLRITQKHDTNHFAIIDPACYLYGIAYENMPIAVGDQEFVQKSMTEIYSRLTGNPVSIKIISEV
jgi:hypothetical protein